MRTVSQGIEYFVPETLNFSPGLCRFLNVSAVYLLFGNTPGSEERELAEKLASVDPKYKEQVMKGITVLLDIADIK